MARNSFWRFLMMAVQRLIALILAFCLARWLGPADYGLLGAATAFAGLFSAMHGNNLPSLLVRELVRLPDQAVAIMGSAIFLRFILGLAALGLMGICLLFPWHPGGVFGLLSFLSAAFNLPASVLQSYRSWFRSRLSEKAYIPSTLTMHALRMAAKLGVAGGGGPLWGIPLMEPIAGVLLCFWQGRLWRKTSGVREPLRVEKTWLKRLWQEGWPILVWGSVNSIYNSVDQLMLASMLGTEATGLYLAAYKLSQSLTLIPALILPSLLPYMTSLLSESPARFHLRSQQIFWAFTWASILASLAVSQVTGPLISLVFGPAYQSSGAVLDVLIWGNIFAFQSLARGQWILVAGLQRAAVVFALLGAVINILLNLLLIPRYGPLGAAWATLCSRGLAVMVVPLFQRRTRVSSLMLLRSFVPWWPGEGSTPKGSGPSPYS